MQLLLIRESESRLISRLFIFEFFQGAAIALYFLTAITIFVHHLPETDLPKVFILSAFLLWFFGFIYNQLEHRLLTKHLIYFVLIFNGVSIALFALFIHLETETWFLYIFLASFNILYLLNNLEFWGLVAILFDVRQGKRLFAIVSSWDGPARITGYLLSFVLGTVIGTENLLWIAAFFMLSSILLFIPLAKSDELKNISPTDHHHYASQNIQHIQAAVTASTLIRNTALVSFFSFCFYLITNFVLYGYVKKRFDTDVSLNRFFAIFLIASRGLTLIIKPLFVNRLLDKLGIRKSLLVSPLLLLILSGVAVFFSNYFMAPFYLFLVMAIVVDILRSAIQSPVLLTTLQPLAVHQRLKGHTIIKGLTDPFAFLAVGILLHMIIPDSTIRIDLRLLSVILFVITILWIYFAVSVDRNYIQTLSAAIRRRLLNERDISLTDNDSLSFLLKKIEDGTEEECVAILQLVSAQPVNHEKFYLKAFRHPSLRVKQLAFRYTQSQHHDALLPELKKMLQAPDVESYLPQLLRCMTALDSGEDISGYLAHENPEVSNAVAMGLVARDHPQKEKAYHHIKKLFASAEVVDKINGLNIVREMKIHQFSDEVAALIVHENETVRNNAVLTAGKLADENTLARLLTIYQQSEKDKYILQALELSGAAAVGPVRYFIQNRHPVKHKRFQLYVLLGKIGNDAAARLLQECLLQFPEDEYNLLSILYQPHFASPHNHDIYIDLVKKNIENASAHMFTLDALNGHDRRYHILIRALELELINIRDKCLFLFSFLYDREKVRKAKIGFELRTKESVANAYELIDMVVPKEYSVPFMLIFEQGDLSYNSTQLMKFFKHAPLTVNSIINNILDDKTHKFSDWTKASCLYQLKRQLDLLDTKMIEPYTRSDNPILKETAMNLMEEINEINQGN